MGVDRDRVAPAGGPRRGRALGPAEPPPDDGAGGRDLHELRGVGEVGGGARRAVPPEQARRGNEDAAHDRDRVRDEARAVGRRNAGADGDVDALADEVDQVVFEAQVDREVRVPLDEARQPRGDDDAAVRERRAHHERAVHPLRAAQVVARRRHLAQHALAVLVPPAPRLGDVQAPGRADDERGAEVGLERGELPAHRGQREARGPRRRREAAPLDDAHEGRHLVEQVHVTGEGARFFRPAQESVAAGPPTAVERRGAEWAAR